MKVKEEPCEEKSQEKMTKEPNDKVRKSSNSDLTCKICKKTSASKEILVQHMKRSHTTEFDCDVFECDFCCLKFVQKSRLLRHLKKSTKAEKLKSSSATWTEEFLTQNINFAVTCNGIGRQ